MKFKNRLKVSFCIIIFVPILLTSLMLAAFMKIQEKNFSEEFSIDGNYQTMTNSIALLSHYTDQEYKQLMQWEKHSSEKFLSEKDQTSMNRLLSAKNSYLLVRFNDEVIYSGASNKDDAVDASDLPGYGQTTDSGRFIAVSSDGTEMVVRQVDFAVEGLGTGEADIVTSTDEMLPEIRKAIISFIICEILILIFTALLLMTWIYQGFAPRMRALEKAADNIKEGNLDFHVDTSGSRDELGELGEAFEEMRQRLWDDAQEKLRNENEERQLISSIAHDLKTPLTAISGYSEGLLDGVASTPEKQQVYLKTIHAKAQEMNTLLNELSLYSKIDTNRIPYDFHHLSVKDYYMDCVEEIGMDLEAQGIKLSFYNYVPEDVEMIADPEQLSRVIHNIVGNSVKYMDKDQPAISIRIKDVGDFVQTEIEDNGRGIAAEDLPYIFDRMFRADSSRNSKIGGSGIGLAIAKKIINDHGGQIWATSKLGQGTVMYFVVRKYQEAGI